MNFSQKYLHDVGIVRSYNDEKYKLVHMGALMQKGFEDERKHTAKGEAGNEDKLQDNLSRAKQRIFELAYCNPWEWFVTLTLDPQKYNRYDLEKYIKDLSQFIRDYRKRSGNELKYLLIPETHESGAWHFHGFFMNLPKAELHKFTEFEHLPYSILSKLTKGKVIYTWQAYADKFGYACIESIKNHEAVSKYITKYITKDAMRTITELNAHTFYASKGLNCSRVIGQDFMLCEINSPDYQNEHCAVKWFDTKAEALEYITTEKK